MFSYKTNRNLNKHLKLKKKNNKINQGGGNWKPEMYKHKHKYHQMWYPLMTDWKQMQLIKIQGADNELKGLMARQTDNRKKSHPSFTMIGDIQMQWMPLLCLKTATKCV